MESRYMSRHPEPTSIHEDPQLLLFKWLKSPTVIIVAVGILFTAFYQSLHSSPFTRHRHPGELLWDTIITLTPAALLYTIDDWLNPSMFPVSKALRPRTFTAKSELLRKLLGMDQPGGGIIGSVTSAGKKSLSTLSGASLLKKSCSNAPAGLGNNDYSCFQNSILQGLASLQPLPDYLASARSDEDPEAASKEGSASTLQQLIAQLIDYENNGKTLWTPAKLKSLHSWEQQDAQEYYSKLLDEIEKEVAKATKGQAKPAGLESALSKDDTESHHSDDSGYQSVSTTSKPTPEAKTVKNPLEGMTAQRVACVQCGYSEGLSLQPFNCITLNLGNGTMQHDLYELLDSYTQLESIEQVECNKCTLLKAKKLLTMLLERMSGQPETKLAEPKARLEAIEQALEEDDYDEKTLKEKCKVTAQVRSSSTKTKQVVIARPPRSLAIHINRSVFDFNTGNMFKNLAAVRFPRTLDLGPWCLGSADQSAVFRKQRLVDAEKEDLTVDKETWVFDPKSSMISGDHYPSKISGPIYELRAVVTHQGQHENGHYICYRKHPARPAESQQKSESDMIEDDGKSFDDEKTLVETNESEAVDDKWWRMSDEHVWDVTEENVLAQGGVFMLFYDCVDPNSVLSSSLENNDENVKDTTAVRERSPVASVTESREVLHDTSISKNIAQLAVTGEAPQPSPQPQRKIDEPSKEVLNRQQDTSNKDTFVSGLLDRPNSSQHGSRVLTETDRIASSQIPPGALPVTRVGDSFVSSLLGRPNA